MTTQPDAAPPQGDGPRDAETPSPRQMQAAEPPRAGRGQGYPAAFGSSGGAVLFRDYASI